MIEKVDVNMSLAVIGAFIGALLGEVDGLIIALVIFMVIDYITGVLCAIVDKAVDSSIGAIGIVKKVGILLLVIVGNVLDVYVLKQGSICRSMIVFFYLSNEGISILENYNRLGLPFPEKLKKVLAQLTEK